MSFCRTSIVEFNTEADADAFMADYNSNFESMFPEAESVMTSKVSPTLYVNNTVFATMEDMGKKDLEQDKLYWTNTKIV